MIVKGRERSFYSEERRKLGAGETQMSFLSFLLFPRRQAGAEQAWAPRALLL